MGVVERLLKDKAREDADHRHRPQQEAAAHAHRQHHARSGAPQGQQRGEAGGSTRAVSHRAPKRPKEGLGRGVAAWAALPSSSHPTTRQAPNGNAIPGLGPGQGTGNRCLTSYVERPVVGECQEVFAARVPLSVCAKDQESADLRAKWSLERLSIADLSVTPWVGPAQAFVYSECRTPWKDWAVPPPFIYTCYGGDKEMQPCLGVDDYFTCTLGTCIRLSDRPDWPVDWFNVLDPSVYGGFSPVRYDVRQWYCANVQKLPLGEISVGNLGTQIYYAESSNPFVNTECDTNDLLGNPYTQAERDAQCSSVVTETTTFPPCCGACILNKAHEMRMYNCTGFTNIVGDELALEVLANYCRVSQQCVEKRPCGGYPVVMGDPKIFLNPSTYNIGCDQLDSGCAPDGTQCKFRWACDNTLDSLRERLGVWGIPGDTSAAPPPSCWAGAAPGGCHQHRGTAFCVGD